MIKDKKILIFVVLIFFGAILAQQIISRPVKLSDWVPSERAEKFSISGGDELSSFTKRVTVDPFEPKLGERQIFSIWVKDEVGISRVMANIVTDSDQQGIELELVEGNAKEGRWIGERIVKGMDDNERYSAFFEAFNFDGQKIEMIF